MCRPTILAGSESDKPDLHFHEKEERRFHERAHPCISGKDKWGLVSVW